MDDQHEDHQCEEDPHLIHGIHSQATVPCDWEEDRYACIPENTCIPKTIILSVIDKPYFCNQLTKEHMGEMNDDDKMSLYYSWRRLQLQDPGTVLKSVDLWSMDLRMRNLLFLEWTDLQLHKILHDADKMREEEELEYHKNVAYEMEYMEYMEYMDNDDHSTPPMDLRMRKLLFLEWTDFQLHKILHDADKMREEEELEYHKTVAYEMEYMDYMDNDDHSTTPPSSSDSIDETDEIREGKELQYHQKIAYEMEYIDHDEYNS